MSAKDRKQMTAEKTASMHRIARSQVEKNWREAGHQYVDRAAFVRHWALQIPSTLAYVNGERLRFSEEEISAWIREEIGP